LVVQGHGPRIDIPVDGLEPIAAISRDGRWVAAVTDKRVRVWSATSGKPSGAERRFDRDILSAEFIPGGDNLLIVGREERDRTIWVRNANAVITVGAFRDYRSDVRGRLFAALTYHGPIRVWDLPTGREVTIEGRGTPRALAFSPSGALIGIGFENNTAQIFDVGTGAAVSPLITHRGPVESIEFSADDRLVVTTSAEGAVRVWEVNTGLALTPPLDHGESVKRAGFAQAGSRVVSAGADAWAKVWDIAPSLEAIGVIRRTSELLAGVSQDPSGRFIPLTRDTLRSVLGTDSSVVPLAASSR
jgi:WD40 repeat protein